MFATKKLPKPNSDQLFQDFTSELTSTQYHESFEPSTEIKPLDGKEDQRKIHGVSSAAVAKEVAHEIDPEIDSDIEVMCMILQASEQSKHEFDLFKEQLAAQNRDSVDPVRRTTSMDPPLCPKLMKNFSRAGTMP